jgi:hypothetical protein
LGHISRNRGRIIRDILSIALPTLVRHVFGFETDRNRQMGYGRSFLDQSFHTSHTHCFTEEMENSGQRIWHSVAN